MNAIKEGQGDAPNVWDGYVGQISAKAASKARDEQRVVKIESQTKTRFL